MSIPASNLVQVLPGVVAATSNALLLNGLFLTENIAMPTGQVYAFASVSAVSKFFGSASAEAVQAAIYFAGYTGATQQPQYMLFAAYNAVARAAFLNGGSLATLTLTQLQALTGTITLTINGTTETSSEINFSGAASFTAAAALIMAAFTGTVPAVTYNAVTSSFEFTSPTTGTGSTITFATAGTLANALALTSATGAYLSQGAAADTPASAMANAVANSQNFASVVTLFEPVLADKVNFATWFNAQNNRYLYLAWDTDAQAIVQNATEPFGVVALAAEYNGVACISGNAADMPSSTTLAAAALAAATFVAGAIASIDFSATNGRITLAYRSQSGLTPTCTDASTASILLANGYSFYGQYATATQSFLCFQNGQMPGVFEWLDSFVNQVYMNAQFQTDDLTLLINVGSVPYTPAGYSLLRTSKADTISAMLNFGAIRAGVTLSAAEIAEINTAAGVDAATPVQSVGYYLQILDPGATVRAARGTPIQNFWYADGGSVQMLTLNSIDVQ